MANEQDIGRAFSVYLDRLIAQHPIAIIHYGSSTRPEDHVPVVSDLDLLIISEAPLNDIDNDLGCDYLFVHPNTFISRLATGNMFAVSALQSGRVLYDPHGFVDAVRALERAGFQIKPGLIALRECMFLTDMHLTMAINLYLAAAPTVAHAQGIAKALYKAAKGIGGFYAIAATGADPHGYSGILREVAPNHRLADLMRLTRRLYENHSAIDLAACIRYFIDPSDVLGAAILELETVRFDELFLMPGRQKTTAIIDEWVRREGPLDAQLSAYVSLDSHIVLGRARGRCYAFGYLRTATADPVFRSCTVADTRPPLPELLRTLSS